MLNVDMVTAMLAMFSKTLQKEVRLLRGFERSDQRILAAREVIILDIDKKQSSFHDAAKYSRTLRKRSQPPARAEVDSISRNVQGLKSHRLA
jgi:hypothetical protein